MRPWTVAAALLMLLGPASRDTPAQHLPGWFDLPVAGGRATLAAIGIPPEERALTLTIAARAIDDRETRIALTPARVAGLLAAMAAPTVGATTDREYIDIPAPLDLETWRQLLDLGPDDDLFAQLLVDHRALRLAVALTATDDSIRSLAASDRQLLRFLYREASGAFVVAARHLRLADGELVVPGGREAAGIWQALAGAHPANPPAFLRALLSTDSGRLAWYFDTLAGLDQARLTLAWPAGSHPSRLAAARALYQAFRDSDAHWQIAEHPFRRHVADAAMLVAMVDVAHDRLAGPSLHGLWALLFAGRELDHPSAARLLTDREPAGGKPVSLAWLAREITLGRNADRRARFETFRLAQRAFPQHDSADLPDIAVALSGHRQYPALLLALERMQLPDAATWAAVVDAARHVTRTARDRPHAIVAFQAAIALVERMRHVRTMDVATANRVLRALCDAVRADRAVAPSVARWITDTLIPAVPRLIRPDAFTGRTAYESTLLQALAGPLDRATPAIDWEGLRYVVDVVGAEHRRLRAVRLHLPAPGLDAALATGKPAMLAAALKALVYSTALGDPDGPISLGRDVATRHDFGFRATAAVRATAPWSVPEERHGRGPWHVHGSLLGLDLGLSRLALRRLADGRLPPAPTLTLNDFGTLTRTIVGLVALDLRDGDRDELAAAIARGRARIAATAGDAGALEALAREARISAAARELLPWIATRQPEHIAAIFSLRDLLWLGVPTLAREQLDRWGVSGEGLDGRRVPAMPPPGAWEDFAGRADTGQMTTQVPDLTLRLVEQTARMAIPAMLVPSLLAFATSDHWHDVRARFSDDWPVMTRQATMLDAARIEDYLAALTAGGPLGTP
jgi:hypothetical protein